MKRLYNFLSNIERRKLRNRKRLSDKDIKYLRLSVFKSNRHFYVQLIDDIQGITVASASTLDPKIRTQCKSRVNAESVKQVVSLTCGRLSDFKEQQLVFDRGAYKYVGLIAQFAEGLRSFGFKF